jgi:hypothetical protein
VHTSGEEVLHFRVEAALAMASDGDIVTFLHERISDWCRSTDDELRDELAGHGFERRANPSKTRVYT